jgi:hypothetical protein
VTQQFLNHLTVIVIINGNADTGGDNAGTGTGDDSIIASRNFVDLRLRLRLWCGD